MNSNEKDFGTNYGTILFWNVDTQYDFMRSDESFNGALPVGGARVIEENLEKLTSIAEKYELKVVNTADWHTMDDTEISLNPDFKRTYPQHCMQGTKGAQYISATDPKDPLIVSWKDKAFNTESISGNRNILLYKNKFDAFEGNPYTKTILDMINPDTVIVYGVATNICVDMAVQGLVKNKKEVYVVKDAIKEVPNEIAATSLEMITDSWKKEHVKFIETKDVEKFVRKNELNKTVDMLRSEN
jgi:nicotinamidase/pyrazinamidase